MCVMLTVVNVLCLTIRTFPYQLPFFFFVCTWYYCRLSFAFAFLPLKLFAFFTRLLVLNFVSFYFIYLVCPCPRRREHQENHYLKKKNRPDLLNKCINRKCPIRWRKRWDKKGTANYCPSEVVQSQHSGQDSSGYP